MDASVRGLSWFNILQEDQVAEAKHFVEINCPVEDVFAFIADGEKCPQWRSGILDIRRRMSRSSWNLVW